MPSKLRGCVRLKGQSGIWRNHPEETGRTLDSRGYTSLSGVQGILHLNTDTTHHHRITKCCQAINHQFHCRLLCLIIIVHFIIPDSSHKAQNLTTCLGRMIVPYRAAPKSAAALCTYSLLILVQLKQSQLTSSTCLIHACVDETWNVSIIEMYKCGDKNNVDDGDDDELIVSVLSLCLLLKLISISVVFCCHSGLDE